MSEFYRKLNITYILKISPYKFFKMIAACWNPEAQFHTEIPLYFQEKVQLHSQNYAKTWPIL